MSEAHKGLLEKGKEKSIFTLKSQVATEGLQKTKIEFGKIKTTEASIGLL